MLEVSNISDNIYTQENIGDTNKVYSCFITGSDQIWNLKITNNDLNYFLKFVEDDKKRWQLAHQLVKNGLLKKENK